MDTHTKDHQQMSSEKSKTGTTINEWARAIRIRKGNQKLAQQLDEDRLTGFRAMEKLRLPHFKQETIALAAFLHDPQKYLERLGSQKFYVNLLPRKGQLTRYRQIDLSQEEVVPFVQEHVPVSQIESYLVVLFEFHENQYSGNIVISPGGEIVVEMVKGSHAPLVSGAKTPEFFVRRDEFTGNLSYSFGDQALRKAVWNLLLAIPHFNEDTSTERINRHTRFTPGYYEFALIKRRQAEPLTVIFIDYRANNAYQLPTSGISSSTNPCMHED